MSTFELHSRSRMAKTLGPVLSVALLSTLAACTPTTGTDTTGDESSSSMMEQSSAPMMDSSSSAEAMMMKSSTPAMAHAYADGTYSAQGAYRSPAGGELVTISLTLKGDVVTNATFSGDATNPKSKTMQAAFASGFMSQVVGKSLDEVSVGIVNGSSLTGIGFMEAVGKIKADAKS